jgi:glucosamine--fructose-6-phosphate aminotransferase (isomerizing)
MAGSLILKEASKTNAEALTGGHFRHGPLEMVSSATSALVFSPAGRTTGIARRLAAEMASYGARVAIVGPREPGGKRGGLPLIETPSLDEDVAPLVEIAAAELLAAACARARGHEPGRFERMGKVTREE